MRARNQAFAISTTPLISHYPLPLRCYTFQHVSPLSSLSPSDLLYNFLAPFSGAVSQSFAPVVNSLIPHPPPSSPLSAWIYTFSVHTISEVMVAWDCYSGPCCPLIYQCRGAKIPSPPLTPPPHPQLRYEALYTSILVYTRAGPLKSQSLSPYSGPFSGSDYLIKCEDYFRVSK